MAVKRKKLTKKEIEQNRWIKKELQKKGLMPPDKPRLNRKLFAQEVCKEWDEMDYINTRLVMLVLSMMTNSGKLIPVTLEDIGILKLKKCVLTLQPALEENPDMKIDEMIQLIKPIWKL